MLRLRLRIRPVHQQRQGILPHSGYPSGMLQGELVSILISEKQLAIPNKTHHRRVICQDTERSVRCLQAAVSGPVLPPRASARPNA